MVNYERLPAASSYFNGKLYQAMRDDLQLAGMSKRTVHGYLRAVRQLADYCKRRPNKITEAQIRRYFLHLKNEKNFAYGSIRVAYSGIKFFYSRTCKRSWQTLATMKLQQAKTLPEVLRKGGHPIPPFSFFYSSTKSSGLTQTYTEEQKLVTDTKNLPRKQAFMKLLLLSFASLAVDSQHG